MVSIHYHVYVKLCMVQLDKAQCQEKSQVFFHYFRPFLGKLNDGGPSLFVLHTSTHAHTAVRMLRNVP